MDILVGIPILLLIALVVVFLFRSIKYGSGLGALFKARITSTVGTVTVLDAPRGLHISVHALGKQEPGWVGLAFEQENGENWQISPLTLSKEEALELSKLLADAAGPA